MLVYQRVPEILRWTVKFTHSSATNTLMGTLSLRKDYGRSPGIEGMFEAFAQVAAISITRKYPPPKHCRHRNPNSKGGNWANNSANAAVE